MGKIIVKEDAAMDAADKDLEVTSIDMTTATKKKSKSTVKPGSELVLASSRAVAAVNAADADEGAASADDDGAKSTKKSAAKKKTSTTSKSTGAKKSSIKVVDLGGDALMDELAEAGTAEGAEIDTKEPTDTAKATGGAGATEATVKTAKAPKSAKGAKNGAKSVSGMVIDGTIKPGTKGAKETVDAEADGYALDEAKLSEQKKEETEEPEFKGEPKYTKGKSALIGVGVALVVAIAGFIGIWWFSRTPTQSCVVQFEANGGSFVNSTEMVCGNSLAKPEDPTKEGFEFQGWVYDGAPFDFENDTVEKDMILVARWSVKSDTEIVRVKFDTQGGTAIEGFDIAKGKTLNPPLTPTKDGYTFDGWYLGDERFDFLTPVNEPITLVAHWKEVPQESNSNSGANNNQQGSSNGSSSNVAQQKCDYLRKENATFSELLVGESSAPLTPYLGYMTTNYCKVTYRSSNEGVMKIESGKAVGVKAGSVALSVCVSELSGGRDLDCVKIDTKVNEPYKEPDPVAVESVTVDKGGVLNLNLTDAKTGMINWTVYPTNATDKAVTLTSDNPSVATVGQDGLVTAVAAGTATITVKTRDGGKTATVTVTVAGAPAPTCKDGEVLDENGDCVPEKPDQTSTDCPAGQVWDEGSKACKTESTENNGA